MMNDMSLLFTKGGKYKGNIAVLFSDIISPEKEK